MTSAMPPPLAAAHFDVSPARSRDSGVISISEAVRERVVG